MADYTKVFDGAAKDAADSTVLGADHDTEFEAISTAVATKADKVTSPVAGNLLELDAAGNLVDSGIASANLDSLSAVVETRLDGIDTTVALVTPAAQPTDHIRAGFLNLWDGETAAASTVALNTAVTETTWETIGPTGSGADVIWTALDNLPSNARVLLLSFTAEISENASGFIASVHTADGDVTTPNGDGASIRFYLKSATGTGNVSGSSNTAMVPCNSSHVFKVNWTITNGTTITTFAMDYQGYVADTV